MTVAFVFQGGSSLAAVQVGMLRALTEAGIVPDIVVGCSAGAINAVGFARNPTQSGVDELRRMWLKVRRRDVFPMSPRAMLAGLTGRGDGLVKPTRLQSLLERELRVRELRATTIRAHVVATDATSGNPVVLSEGPAVQALLASSAIPGLLSPVVWGGRPLIDGGISADTPILQAEALGATTSYVLPSLVEAPADGPAAGALPNMLRSLNMLVGRSSANDLAAARGEVHMLPVPTLHGVNPLDFRRSAEYIRIGYDSARGWLSRRPALVAV